LAFFGKVFADVEFEVAFDRFDFSTPNTESRVLGSSAWIFPFAGTNQSECVVEPVYFSD